MFYAKRGVLPPKEWEHYKLLKNFNKNTVAYCLSKNGIIPPK